MARLRLINVSKRFGRVVAVDQVSFEVNDGEFFAILGPSGSGKTTLLRLIAGLETPDEGEIWIDDRNVTYLHPKQRDIAMVFQNYALYPHMSVYENIAFPLKMRKSELKLSEDDIRESVIKISKMLGIEDLLDRKPSQLSGGQQQRVALARALVRRPKVWLLDEPLSNLDAKLRLYMRSELRKLQRDLKITTVYVTHDQAEAMSMADRIAVMNQGRILQIGDAEDLYSRPADTFIASFIGVPPINIVECGVRESSGKTLLECLGSDIELDPEISRELSSKLQSGKILIGVRPEHIMIYKSPTEKNLVKTRVVVVEKMGSEQILHLTPSGGDIVIRVKVGGDYKVSIDDEVYVKIPVEKLLFFDPRTNKLLL